MTPPRNKKPSLKINVSGSLVIGRNTLEDLVRVSPEKIIRAFISGTPDRLSGRAKALKEKSF